MHFILLNPLNLFARTSREPVLQTGDAALAVLAAPAIVRAQTTANPGRTPSTS